MTDNIVLSAYALFLILGGFLGLRKGSKVSFIMGLVSGILVLAGFWGTTVAPKTAWTFLVCLNVLLCLAFISRLNKTRKFMPSGMLLLTALAVLIFCLTHFHA